MLGSPYFSDNSVEAQTLRNCSEQAVSCREEHRLSGFHSLYLLGSLGVLGHLRRDNKHLSKVNRYKCW